jgi:hypothetical protein
VAVAVWLAYQNVPVDQFARSLLDNAFGCPAPLPVPDDTNGCAVELSRRAVHVALCAAGVLAMFAAARLPRLDTRWVHRLPSSIAAALITVAMALIDMVDRGDHALKGVPGSWKLFEVVS